MNPEEIEFLAEKQIISIVPNFNSTTIHLISGDFGPFRAGLPTKVPLWMAVSLKQQRKCRIQQPDWMEMEQLEAIKEEEKKASNFTKMPSEHYIVEAKLLLDCASDDIPHSDEIRTIIKDIWDIRMSKLRSSVDLLVRSAGCYAAVDNLTPMEINTVRPILPDALNQIYRMRNGAQVDDSQSQSTSSLLDSSRASTSGR